MNAVCPSHAARNRIMDNDTIIGYCFPWKDGQPLWVDFPHAGTGDIFLTLFSTLDKLKTTMLLVGLTYDKVKKIDDDVDFLDSIPSRFPNGTRIRIIVDPMLIENGNVTFTEIRRDFL